MTRPRTRVGWIAVLFDLDGTLLDTRPGIRAALARSLDDVLGMPGLPSEPDWSLPIGDLVQHLLPAGSPDQHRAVVESFRRHYDGGLWEEAEPFPGAESCLAVLRASGMRLFVVTNKRRTAAELLMQRFGLAVHVEMVVSQPDAGDPIPKADLAGGCLRTAGVQPRAAAVVGDSVYDEAMAAAWNMTFVAITSGTGPLTGRPAYSKRVEVGSLTDAASYLLHSSPGRGS